MWRGRSKIIEDLYANKVILSAKTDYYNCKRFYVSPVVITEKIPIEVTQKKMKKKSKNITTKKKINTRE